MRIIFTVLLVSLFVSCSKSPNEIHGQPTLRDSARTWWDAKHFESSSAFATDWEASETTITIDGIRILEVPIRFQENLYGEINGVHVPGEKKTDSLYTYRSLIIYNHPKKGFYYGIMKLVGTKNYNSRVAVKKNSFANLSHHFEGLFLLERLDGSFITGVRYKWGVKPVQIRLKPSGPTTELLVCDQVTNNFYQQVCRGGVCGEPRLISSVTYLENCTWYPEAGEEPPIDYKVPPDGGGGYNPPTETVEDETQEIRINLTDTCQRAVASRIVDGNWSNEIIKDVNAIFNQPNKRYNITFKDASQYTVDYPSQAPMLPITDGRMTVPSYSPTSMNINIYVNTPASASREYISVVLIHEIIHAIYAAENGAPTSGNMDHNKMQNYLTVMDNALLELYPSIDPSHVRAMNLQGLGKTVFGATLKNIFPEIWNTNISVADQYRFGNLGTNCR